MQKDGAAPQKPILPNSPLASHQETLSMPKSASLQKLSAANQRSGQTTQPFGPEDRPAPHEHLSERFPLSLEPSAVREAVLLKRMRNFAGQLEQCQFCGESVRLHRQQSLKPPQSHPNEGSAEAGGLFQAQAE